MPPPVPASRRPSRAFLHAAAVGLAFYLAGQACVSLPQAEVRVAPIWLANAVALAALLRTRTRGWPLIVAACFAANLFVGSGPARIGVALAYASGNAVEYGLSAVLLRRLLGADIRMDRARDLVVLALVACAATLAAAPAAAGLLAITRGDALAPVVRAWALGHPLSLLMLTPCLLVIGRWREHLAETPPTRRAALALSALLVCAAFVFGQSRAPILFLIPPMLLAVALEMGVLGAATGVLLTAAVALAAGLHGTGPLALVKGDQLFKDLVLQLFLVTALFSGLPVAALRSRERRARREAEAAAAAKAEFLANMSHELRTPLTAVLGFAGLVAEQPELSDASRRYLERVRVAGKALLGTVNDVLDFSRLEAGQVELSLRPADPAAVARESLELFEQDAAAKGIALHLSVADVPARVEMDEDRVRQVLVNLLGNAVKFTERGEVRLEAEYGEGALSFRVRDTGAGIAPEEKARLFLRFTQVDGSSTRRHGGSGLGLAICKGLVEAMGGSVWVESSLGEGSCFGARIPAPSVAPLADGAAPALAPVSLVDAHVLLVDDKDANRELTAAALRAMGLTVDPVASGDLAVRCAALQAYDLILMDLRMPGLQGAAAARLIRAGGALNARTPLIAFSADVMAATDPVFDGVLAKPLSPAALAALLRRHLGGAGRSLESAHAA